MQSNSRGNTWSRRHESLTPEDARFWDFSWDEMAAYDLPAVIDHVLAATGRAQLAYVGVSEALLQNPLGPPDSTHAAGEAEP